MLRKEKGFIFNRVIDRCGDHRYYCCNCCSEPADRDSAVKTQPDSGRLARHRYGVGIL